MSGLDNPPNLTMQLIKQSSCPNYLKVKQGQQYLQVVFDQANVLCGGQWRERVLRPSGIISSLKS